MLKGRKDSGGLKDTGKTDNGRWKEGHSTYRGRKDTVCRRDGCRKSEGWMPQSRRTNRHKSLNNGVDLVAICTLFNGCSMDGKLQN